VRVVQSYRWPDPSSTITRPTVHAAPHTPVHVSPGKGRQPAGVPGSEEFEEEVVY